MEREPDHGTGRLVRMVCEHIGGMPLVDDHVHSVLRESPSEERFEGLLCESAGPLGRGQSRLDSQAGFALVSNCSPLLFGKRCGAREYFGRRRRIPESEIDGVFLPAAGVSDWIVDPGWGGSELVGLDEMSEVSHGDVHRLVRLESVAEGILLGGRCDDFVGAFRHGMSEAAEGAVGFKTICAYRCGLDIDWRRPSDDAVRERVAAMTSGERSRLSDPVVCSFMLHEAMRYGRPIQFHIGIGDRDVDIRHSNPFDLRDLLVEAEDSGVPIVLLHCWPYERECGYLCQNFTNVYMDVGLTTYLSGNQGIDAIRRALQLCPFSRFMYSSDAWGLPEQHFFSAVLFRRALACLTSRWVEDRSWDFDDAIRVVDLIGSGNARRLYRL